MTTGPEELVADLREMAAQIAGPSALNFDAWNAERLTQAADALASLIRERDQARFNASGLQNRLSAAEAERDALRGVVEAKDRVLDEIASLDFGLVGDIARASLSAGVGSPSESKGSVAGEAGASSALPPTAATQVCEPSEGSVSSSYSDMERR